MSSLLTDDTKTIILLCGVFGKERDSKPLTQTEYSRLASYLLSVGMRPSDLQTSALNQVARASCLEEKRLNELLNRGVQLAFSVEEWQRNGIWVISRSDSQYPIRFKRHLREKAPPLLFGVGDPQLIDQGGLGIVGSRNVDRNGEIFTHKAAQRAAQAKMVVVSGGARGVDSIAMTTAIENGGFTVGVLAEQLLKKSLVKANREAIAEGRLLLISAYHPNARFTVGTAMARNKLIYALADYNLVVSAEHNKGGTWAGASEELRRSSARPVFVRIDGSEPAGNRKLMDLGAQEWPPNSDANLIQQLQKWSLVETKKPPQENDVLEPMNLFNFDVLRETKKEQPAKGATSQQSVPSREDVPSTPCKADNIYELVLPIILKGMGEPVTVDELAKSLNLVKTQLTEWLGKAIEEKKVMKLVRPVRYQLAISKERKSQAPSGSVSVNFSRGAMS